MASPDLLQKLAAYVPTPAAQAIYRQPHNLIEPAARRFLAAVLFTDISGFTPLSELLGQAGPTGAEELTNLINQYFTRMIQIVQLYHGQVVKFSGDALTVLFPAEDISLAMAVRRAAECALTMQTQMSHFAALKTSRGSASLSMKAGIGAGKVLECTIGGVRNHWEYVVGGAPLAQVSMAERLAQPGQVILSPLAWQEACSFFVGNPCADSGFVALNAITNYLPESPPEVLDWTRLTPEQAKIAEQALQGYVPLTVTSRLNEQADWLAELRRIIVLFVGIGGFDYEAADAAERLQNFLHAIQEVVNRFEGTLNKVAVDDKGTVLLILFGAPPFSHEDDITRAVACALEMQSVGKEQGLRMSIGIAEGGLFAGPVGAPSRREYTVIGDTVNLATRLMQYGRAGMIVVNQRIIERAGSQFQVESMGEITVKGRSDSVAAYIVKGVQVNQDEFIMRYLAPEKPLVGRQCELKQVQRIAASVHEQGLQILFIEGELGLGKSRLVSELVQEWMMAGGVGFGCKGISYGRQIPYQAWRDVLAALFGLTPALSSERRLARLAASIADLPDPPGQPNFWGDRLPLLADVLGVEVPENNFTHNISGQLRRNNTFALIEALIRHQVKRRALLILLEDIHWADELSLALVAYLARNLADVPLLLVLVHRPMVSPEMELLADVKNLPYAHTIHLDPLTLEESKELSRIFLGDKKVPPEVEEILLNRGQGNPFFLQEIAGAILDVAAKQIDQASKRLDNLNLPDTVQDVILTRVDRLSEEEKLTLKVASVIGPSFQRSLLLAAHPLHQTRFLLSTQLDDLEKEKLIRLESPAPKWEYMFHNVVTQEVVYEGLLLAQRRQLHRLVGEALESLVPDEVEQLAFHYSRSDDSAKAIYYLKIAGDKARREYANQVAINYYSQILNLLAGQSVLGSGQGMVTIEYWDILLERAKLNNLIGRRDEAIEDLGTLGVIAEALQDDYRRVLVTKQWANLYEATGDYDSALEVIERCVLLGQKVGQDKLVGEGYNQWGKLLFLFGEYETADDYLQRALVIAQNHHDKATQADCLNSLGLVGHYQNDYEVALYFFEEAMGLWREIGDRIGLGSSLSNLGRVYYDMGQYTQAQQCYEQSLRLHHTIGDRAGEGLTKCNLGILMRTLGNYSAASDLLKDALVINKEVGDRRGVVYALYQLAFLQTRLTEYDEAIKLFTEALDILQDINDSRIMGDTLTLYGWTLYEDGQLRQAKKFLEEALKTQRDTQQEVKMIECVAHLGRVALATGDLSLADTCARRALDFITARGTAGIEHPALVYLACYQILQANKKTTQAHAVLGLAQEYLNTQSAHLKDPALQQSYLNSIPENRRLHELKL